MGKQTAFHSIKTRLRCFNTLTAIIYGEGDYGDMGNDKHKLGTSGHVQAECTAHLTYKSFEGALLLPEWNWVMWQGV